MAVSQFQQHVLKKDLKKERHRRNQWRQVILTKSISDPFGLKASQEKSDYSERSRYFLILLQAQEIALHVFSYRRRN